MEQQVLTFYPKSRKEWRAWLQENHANQTSIWLIYYKKNTNMPGITYSEAVDEALCFGWIDSKSKPIDDEKYMQFFCKRKPNSTWSRVNKEKIRRLIEEKLMTHAGYESIETAKQNGSWTILDDAEDLIIPEDLTLEFKKNPNASAYFSGLSRSDKRNMLQWLVLAKRAETRRNRIMEIVTLAGEQQKPKQFRGVKKGLA